MTRRPSALLREAERQLERARAAHLAGRPVWAWFAAHQSAELALKALRQSHALNGRERIIGRLLLDLPEGVHVPDELRQRADVLDSHYIPVQLDDLPLDEVRPNGAPPSDYAIEVATDLLTLVRKQLPRPR